MVKLIAGKYGPKLLGPGTILNLDESTEKRLVERKIAVYVDDNVNNTVTDDKIVIKSVVELNKIRSKKELVMYAENIGLHTLDESASKKELIDAIINYSDESFRE